MNDDSRLDCSDYPCSGCGFTQGDCHCTPEQVESAHHIAQQAKCAMLPCLGYLESECEDCVNYNLYRKP